MRYAYASKHQMKVWNSAAKPDRDYPGWNQNVMFQIKLKDGGYIATLTATDGYQLMRRNIQTDDDATQELKVAIPRQSIEQAEKAMKLGDRAYFDDGKIQIVEILEDPDTEEDIERIKCYVPFFEQMDMFKDLDSPIEAEANKDYPEKVVTLDAKLLKKVAEQLRNGDALCYVTIRAHNVLDGVVMTAFDGIDDEEITAVIMPIKS